MAERAGDLAGLTYEEWILELHPDNVRTMVAPKMEWGGVPVCGKGGRGSWGGGVGTWKVARQPYAPSSSSALLRHLYTVVSQHLDPPAALLCPPLFHHHQIVQSSPNARPVAASPRGEPPDIGGGDEYWIGSIDSGRGPGGGPGGGPSGGSGDSRYSFEAPSTRHAASALTSVLILDSRFYFPGSDHLEIWNSHPLVPHGTRQRGRGWGEVA